MSDKNVRFLFTYKTESLQFGRKWEKTAESRQNYMEKKIIKIKIQMLMELLPIIVYNEPCFLMW